MQHRKLSSNLISNHFDSDKILLHDIDFTDVDLTAIAEKDLALFDFANCLLRNVKLDRIGISFFIKFFKDGKVSYSSLDLSGTNLGRQLFLIPETGIACNISVNLMELDLKNFNFTGCSIEDTPFEGSDIAGTRFFNCMKMNPTQFAFCHNFDKALFFEDSNQDNNFKSQISKINAKGKIQEKPFNSYANFKLAHIFDPADETFKRVTSPSKTSS